MANPEHLAIIEQGVEVREYFIPDFSTWKDHDAFEKGFERLLKDLRAEEKAVG